MSDEQRRSNRSDEKMRRSIRSNNWKDATTTAAGKRQRSQPAQPQQNQSSTTTTTTPLWHKYRKDISDPQFCDVTASVSSITYGARRLPEMKDLWMSSCFSSSNNNYHKSSSTGRKISSRHLRKRVKSFQKKRNIYRAEQYYTSNSNCRILTATTPTTTASSLKEDKGEATIRGSDENDDKEDNVNNNVTAEMCYKNAGSRRKRRKNTSLLSRTHYENWRQPNHRILTKNTMLSSSQQQPQQHAQGHVGDSNNDTAACNNNNHTTKKAVIKNWIMTHIWHTKRFHMSPIPLWGWVVPLLHTNRGTNASLRLGTTTTNNNKNKATNTSASNGTAIITTNDVSSDDDYPEKSLPSSKSSTNKCLLQDSTWCMQPVWFQISCCSNTNNSNNYNDNNNRNTIIRNIQRCIPNFSILDHDNNNNNYKYNTDGRIIHGGEGMIYEKDLFPKNAICPMMWICHPDEPILKYHPNHATTTIMDSNDLDQPRDSNRMFVYFFVHPSVQNKVHFVLQDALLSSSVSDHDGGDINIAENGDGMDNDGVREENCRNLSTKMPDDTSNRYKNQNEVDGPYHGIEGGIGCLKLRGGCSKSSATITRALTVLVNQNRSPSIESMNADERERNRNSVITLNTLASFLKWSSAISSSANDQQRHLSAWIGSIPVHRPLDVSIEHIPLCIQCIRPRDPQYTYNYGVCGYNIMCDPSFCKELFLLFVLECGTCPIGYVDEAYLSLECDPPVLVFPRDHPDTLQGELYWNGSSDEWSIIRNYWEGGSGRILHRSSVKCPDHKRFNVRSIIDMSSHVSCQTESSSMVVVRGVYGEPFKQSLNNCTVHLVPNDNEGTRNETTCHRMKRRRPTVKKSNYHYVHAPSLSKQQIAMIRTYTDTLLRSLTLPATLLCYVQVAGKGRLKPLYTIHSYISDNSENDGFSDDNFRLGYVTGGSFSVARGKFHGIGIIGAALFLQAVAASVTTRSVVLVNGLFDHEKRISLKVWIKHESQCYEGTLSLLL